MPTLLSDVYREVDDLVGQVHEEISRIRKQNLAGRGRTESSRGSEPMLLLNWQNTTCQSFRIRVSLAPGPK